MSQIVDELLAGVRVLRVRAEGGRFARYRNDPVGFAREVLKVKHLWKRQVELLEALARHDRVTVNWKGGSQRRASQRRMT